MREAQAMRIRALRTVGMAVIAAGIALTCATGASTAPTRGQVDQAQARIFDGTWSQADLAVVKSDPKVAAQTPDPTAPLRVVTGSSSAATEITSAARVNTITATSLTNICNASKWVTFYKESLLLTDIYGWQHKVVYCRNGATITAWQDRLDWLPTAQSVVQFRELVSVSATGIATNVATSFRQRHIEYCGWLGSWTCYANTYPYSTIKVYANGTWWYSGSAG